MQAAVVKKAPTITYGLRNLHYALKDIAEDGTVTYGDVKKIPGAVNISLTPDGEIFEFYADDGVYFECDESDGYTGDLEISLVPDGFKTDVFGWEKSKDGGLYEIAGAPHKHIALMGEMATDVVAKRVVFYDVFCGRPAVSTQTRQKGMSVQTQKMSITCRPVEFNGKRYVKKTSTPEMSDETYNSFFKAVPIPSAE